MTLPVRPPVAPMLAKLVRELPRDDGLFYEPKWDGFRCIVFRDGDDVELGQPQREAADPLLPRAGRARSGASFPTRCVLDGEIVIAGPARPRLRRAVPAHPPRRDSASACWPSRPPRRSSPSTCWPRRRRLVHGRALTRPGGRAREGARGRCGRPIHLTPVTTDPDVAADWFSALRGRRARRRRGQGRATLPYQPDKRAMLKVKHQRTADCVVAGFRTHKDGAGVGSLLLGLFDGAGTLHHVGVARGSASPAARAGGRARALPRGTPEGPPLGRLGRRPGRRAGARRRQPLERRQGHDAGSPCGPRRCARSPTTTCSRTASAMPRPSCAGAPTASRRRAPTTQLDTPVPSSSTRSSAPRLRASQPSNSGRPPARRARPPPRSR